MNKLQVLAGAFLFSVSAVSHASVFTTVSPTSAGQINSDITEVGGIVVDLIGLNGARVMSQMSADSLYEGKPNYTPLLIGTQSGFDSNVTDLLGGGLSEAAFRFTLWDGDSSPGNFDDGQQNELFVNDVSFGFWGETMTQRTNSIGVARDFGELTLGFSNNRLDTGWFYSDDPASLSSLFDSILSTEELAFMLNDTGKVGDNYFDFTQGIDGGLISVGSGPVVTPIPEPSTYALMLGGLGLVGFMAARRRAKGNV